MKHTSLGLLAVLSMELRALVQLHQEPTSHRVPVFQERVIPDERLFLHYTISVTASLPPGRFKVLLICPSPTHGGMLKS